MKEKKRREGTKRQTMPTNCLRFVQTEENINKFFVFFYCNDRL